MYSVAAYGKMVSDRGRMEPYARALEAVVRPGSTVLDIGTGTGVLALIACRLGAARVYAVEPDPAIEIARENGGTRVELRRRLSSRAALADGPAEDRSAEGAATLALSRERSVTVARLEGEVDLAVVADLAPARAAAVRDSDRGLVLDLDRVCYLDSAGLHLLHDASRTLAARGQALRVVVAPDAPVLRLLELVDIAQTVSLDASVQAAVDALAPPPLL